MTTTIHDVMASMRDIDGSARDLNFLQPDWPATHRLLAWMSENYMLSSAHDSDGNDLRLGDGDRSLEERLGAAGNAQFVFESRCQLPRHLQMFVAVENDGSPFVELTFFPQDVAADATELSVLAWAESIQVLVGATGYFLRYENASWRFGDTGEHSGVIAYSIPATQP